jgi:hypothetical protein
MQGGILHAQSLEKVRSTEQVAAGNPLLLQQGRLKRGLKVLSVEGNIVHTVSNDGVPYDFDLNESGRRWALYAPKAPVPRPTPSPVEKPALTLADLLRNLKSLITRFEEAVPPAPSPALEGAYRALVEWGLSVEEPERAHRSGGFLRVAPMVYRSWCRTHGVDSEELKQWMLDKGFLYLDKRGANPKSNVTGTRCMRILT